MTTAEGTIDPLAVIGGQADIDSKEVEKLFNEAFEKALPEGTKIQSPVVETPAVEETKPEPVAAVEAKVEEKTPVVETKVEDKAVETKTEETKPAAVADPNEWIAKLPEDLRAHAKQVLEERNTFKHQFDSDRQRVIALNKKSMNLERELAALRTQVQKPQPDTQIAAQAAREAVKSSAEWEQLIGADPTLAKAIESKANEIVEARLNAAIGKIDNIAKQRASEAVAPLQQSQQVDERSREVEKLLQVVPNAFDVFESKQYKYWYDNVAAPGIKQIASVSNDHRDVLEVLQVYSRDLPKVVEDLVARGEMEAPPKQAEQPVQKAAVVEDTSKADQVAKQREQKLTQAPVVQQTPVAVIPVAQAGAGASVDLDDPGVQALFEQVFKQNLRSK